jgi:hypothetical protein
LVQQSNNPTDAISFAERLMTVLLYEGKFSATYKFAVLLALMDLCLEHYTAKQAAPTSITTRQVAEKVIELYWSHVLPFGSEGSTVLKQNNGGQAEILTLIQEFRTAAAVKKSSLWNSKANESQLFNRLVDDVEWKLIEMPLPRLQKGKNDVRFMYQISWDENIKRKEIKNSEFDNRILLVNRAGEFLIRLNALLKPYIQRRWAETVARFNVGSVDDYKLEAFLFGLSRETLAPLYFPLRELQGNQCFYCGDRLGSAINIDHFIPWARYANNDIQNLVAVDLLCNNRKRDFFASCSHLEAWTDRNLKRGSDLIQIST